MERLRDVTRAGANLGKQASSHRQHSITRSVTGCTSSWFPKNGKCCYGESDARQMLFARSVWVGNWLCNFV